MVRAYEDAQRRLEKQLSGSKLTDFARFRINEQLAQVNAIVAALNQNVKDALPGMTSAYYEYGADLGSAALQAQGVKLDDLNLGNHVHTAAVQAVAEQMALDLAKANVSTKSAAQRILRKTQQALVSEKQINGIISDGLIVGETRRETSKRLTRELEKALNGGRFVEAGRGRFTPEYYAELVTRTRTREAVTQGAITRSMEYGVTLFQVSIHDNPCDVCKARQGKVYTIVKGDDSGFPYLDARPPFHPHCRHVLLGYVQVPGRKAKDEALRKLSNNKEPIADSLPGYQEAVEQAQLTGGLRKKQIPGEGRTKTVPGFVSDAKSSNQ